MAVRTSWSSGEVLTAADLTDTFAASGGAKGGSTDKVFFENDITVTADYTITTSKNALSAGPITINSGITVTIPSGSVWSVV